MAKTRKARRPQIDEEAVTQRDYFLAIAEKLRHGLELSPTERWNASRALAGFAKAIPIEASRPRGNPNFKRKIDPFLVTVHHRERVRLGEKASRVTADLAEKHDVSEKAIKDALREAGPLVDNLLGSPGARVQLKRSKSRE